MKRFICVVSLMLLAACGGGGGGGSSAGTNSGTSLTAPVSLVATSSASRNTVSWQPVAGATSYNVYWSTSPNVSKTSGNMIVNASSPFVHTGLTDSQRYYYVVTALKDNQESDVSAETSISASKVVAIDAKDFSLIALKSDGSVWVSNNYISSDFTTPKQVSGLTSITKVTVGGTWTSSVGNNFMALKADGTLWAWGDNTYGQLGNGTTTTSITPVKVNISDVVSIYSAEYTNFAIKRDGTVWGWGFNNGALGYVGPTNDYKSSPEQIPNLSGILDVSSDDIRSINFAVKNDGTVWAWGRTDASVLGVGMSAVPVLLPINNVKIISAPYWIAMDGTVWSWASSVFNSNGTPRLATDDSISSPTQLAGIDNALNLSLCRFTVVKADGTVWSAGYDANQTYHLNKINPLNDAISTVSNTLSTYVLRRDGAVVAWNWNSAVPSVQIPAVVGGI